MAGPRSERALAAARMRAHGLVEPLETPGAVVERLLCVQAQDLPAAKWAIAARTAAARVPDVDRAIDRGEIVRTWPMRGTLHLLPAGDVRWMLGLTAERMRRASARRREQLGLTDRDVVRAADASVGALSGGRALDRARLFASWNAAGVDTAGQRGYHLLSLLAIDGLVCHGPVEGRNQRFVLLEEWAPRQRELAGDEALAELAVRYLRGHGPATERDLAWWAGLPLGAVRRGVAAAGTALVRDGQDRLSGADAPAPAAGGELPTVALPGFDEYFLGYADRTPLAPPDAIARIVPGGNGVFRPIVVASGRVAGTWSSTRTGMRAIVDVDPFRDLTARERRRLAASVRRWGCATGADAELAEPASADVERE
ncbi:winged helix DNA-binding domain-containing protein [Agromyces sp. SYSU T00194]|uniref:winged helix DNA-binding domain-containing protein n=1 Tax=Agromyces chitinivorans TaxID=3158560 RepID=UPI003398D991